jgi:hypothetical protein
MAAEAETPEETALGLVVGAGRAVRLVLVDRAPTAVFVVGSEQAGLRYVVVRRGTPIEDVVDDLQLLARAA